MSDWRAVSSQNRWIQADHDRLKQQQMACKKMLLAILVVRSTRCTICSIDCLNVWFSHLRRQVLLRKGGSSQAAVSN